MAYIRHAANPGQQNDGSMADAGANCANAKATTVSMPLELGAQFATWGLIAMCCSDMPENMAESSVCIIL